MKQPLYSLVSMIPEEDQLGRNILKIQARLRDEGITFTSPKLGKHITLVTPFEALPSEMIFLHMGLIIGSEIYRGKKSTHLVRTTKLDFFRGDQGRCLFSVLRLTQGSVLSFQRYAHLCANIRM